MASHPFDAVMTLRLPLLIASLVLAACTSVPTGTPPAPAPDRTPPSFSYQPPLMPEAASGITEKPGWSTRRFAVAAANPLAAHAGYQVLQAGGSAVDAAIAVQMVLTLVEPQSSGIGGGAFLLHYDGKQVEAFDGRETAPASVDEKLFLGADGKPIPFYDAVVGGRSVGVPGAVRMLEMAHRQHGRLPWAQLMQPAIVLAEGGFQVSARLHTLLRNDAHLKKDPVAAAYFYRPDGEPRAVGTVLRNPELAVVLRRIATEGARALHEGEIAQAVVTKVRQHPTNPGTMTLADLSAYQPLKRVPLCHDWRASGRDWRVCGFPPPSSGALAIGQILGILQHTPAASLPLQDGLPSADWLHFYSEAARLAFADRAQYVADPDFTAPPAGRWSSLLDPAYLAARARLIGPQSMKVAEPGTPGGEKSAQAPMPEQLEFGTSHLSIVDGYGQALAMTTTIEDQFGARQMVTTTPGRSGGFLLNNELTDFSFAPADAQGRPIANRVQAGKRPRSSMSPTIVLDAEDRPTLVLGSPGGARIIPYVIQTLVAHLDWGLDIQEAISLPRHATLGGAVEIERGSSLSAAAEALRARGHAVAENDLVSGLQGIALRRGAGGLVLEGGADPRREGEAHGD